MTDPNCKAWMEDPEGQKAHLASCASCAAEAAGLEASALSEDAPSLAETLEPRLPVAPWEGARHRSWGFLAAVLLVLVIGTAGLFFLLGVTFSEGMGAVVNEVGAPRSAIVVLAGAAGDLIRSASPTVLLILVVAVIAVNALLIYLLRRGPRGYDVRAR